MIYRIISNEAFLIHYVPPVEAMKQLGEQHGIFAFNSEPKQYLQVWKALHINFSPSTGSETKLLPDISENFGRLFLSQKAYVVLKSLIAGCGEFLPVTYGENKQGYIYNPLLTAEQFDAIDKNLTIYDQYTNLESFRFIENKIKEANIFKTKLDTYKGIFCNEKIKQVCEKAELTGIIFNLDISNPSGASYATNQ